MADKFYPGDAKKLEATVRNFLADALPPKGEKPIAIIVPHAGYVFSGQIAADAYRQAMGNDYDVVVILGTNHTVPGFDGVSIYLGSGYRTPLGVAPIDKDIVRALLAEDLSFSFKPEVHAREHSEEVQVPFVQVAFPNAKIVTAVVGAPDLALANRLGQALAKVLKGRKALIVASSDLSHYPDYETAVQADRRTLTAAASLDAAAFSKEIAKQMNEGKPGLETCACGEGDIMAAMVAAKALGAKRGIVVSYANSGDTVAGEPDRVVGYGAVMFTAGEGGPDTRALQPQEAAPKSVALADSDRQYLLSLARRTVEGYLLNDFLPFPRAVSPVLRRKQGAFVTLKEHGDLRGCIGFMAEETPLVLTVSRMALEAALHDTRFSPVTAAEVPKLEYEISVLTPFSKVDGPGAIQIGRDGVLIEKSGRRAVFLPQVAPEEGWGREEMLDHLCEKGGLSAGCWRSGCTFYTFQADVFAEKKNK